MIVSDLSLHVNDVAGEKDSAWHKEISLYGGISFRKRPSTGCVINLFKIKFYHLSVKKHN